PVPIAPRLPEPPRSSASLVLGLVALAGGAVLVVPLLAAPIAWYLAACAIRDAERQPERWGPAGQARAGRILGIVGTVLLGLAVLAAAGAALVVGVLAGQSSPYAG
ncbi:hypothetical protein HMPREF0063_12443, partial [Aeromicrobium marinum DSM 15272]